MPLSALLRRVPLVRTGVRLIVTANVIPSPPILAALIMYEIHSSETSVFTSATQRNITEHGMFPSHCRENIKSSKSLPCKKVASIFKVEE
jgi:hypothetical protein